MIRAGSNTFEKHFSATYPQFIMVNKHLLQDESVKIWQSLEITFGPHSGHKDKAMFPHCSNFMSFRLLYRKLQLYAQLPISVKCGYCKIYF